MRRLSATVACVALIGCAPERRAAVVESGPPVVRLSPGCHTVDLFDPYEIQRHGAEVPVEYANFLGVWKNGAWGGTWCHDLYVIRVEADGSVDLLDAHGPNPPVHGATVFRRMGRIDGGVLSFTSVGGARVEYRVVGKYLVGERKGALGTVGITMSRVQGAPSAAEKPTHGS